MALLERRQCGGCGAPLKYRSTVCAYCGTSHDENVSFRVAPTAPPQREMMASNIIMSNILVGNSTMVYSTVRSGSFSTVRITGGGGEQYVYMGADGELYIRP